MSDDVNVVCRHTSQGFTCDVVVGADSAATKHTVSVSQDALARLAPGHYDPQRLVSESFTFLLTREPRESILPTFDLLVIERYFPGYEAHIQRLLQA